MTHKVLEMSKTDIYVSGWVFSCIVNEFPDEGTLFVDKFWLISHSLPFIFKWESPFCGYCTLPLTAFMPLNGNWFYLNLGESLLQLGHFFVTVLYISYVKPYCAGTQCHFNHSSSHHMNSDHLSCMCCCFQMAGNEILATYSWTLTYPSWTV